MSRRTSSTTASRSTGSDLLSIVALWDHLRTQQRELSGNQFRRMCRKEYLNYLRVREWMDLFSQLRRIAGQLGDPTHDPRRPPRPRPPGGARRAAVAHRDARPGDTRVRRRPPVAVRDRAGLGADPAAAAVGDGRRTGGDEPAVRPPGREDRAEVGRAGRRPPREAVATTTSAGIRRPAGPSPPSGHAVRPADRERPLDRLRPRRRGPGPGVVHHQGADRA